VELADQQEARRAGPALPRHPVRHAGRVRAVRGGLAVVVLASGYALGAAWRIAIAATGLVGLAASLAWPPTRQRLIARAWCVITPHEDPGERALCGGLGHHRPFG